MSGDRVDEQELTKMAFEINGTKQNPSMKSEVDILLMSEFEFVKQSVAGKLRGDEERSDLQCFQELIKVLDIDQCGATRSEVDTLLSAEFATVTKCIAGKPITGKYRSSARQKTSERFKISVGDIKKVIQRCIIFIVEAATFLCPCLFEGVNFIRQMTIFVSKVVRAYSCAMKEFLTETIQFATNRYSFRGLQSEAEDQHQD
ncbi:hypothetical protein D8674_029466 [Pyrus ussuriensis x Pyrus communis]|uniref:Uncharacterized protein n=1 Tax=Pyrus ussuriensis x Pyrus communis TaxID=2448454 RepID=A0A5N5I025_9ROSA|nr:hypothetical protein D8674_029466 [Pyrus ussuriensis x Pyrus communis]